MTQETIDILTKYEDRMRTAVYSNYTRSITLSDLTKLRQAYKELTGVEYSIKGSCSACQLAFLKKLGTIWFERKSVQLSPTLITNELEETATTSDISEDDLGNRSNKRTRKNNKK